MASPSCPAARWRTVRSWSGADEVGPLHAARSRQRVDQPAPADGHGPCRVRATVGRLRWRGHAQLGRCRSLARLLARNSGLCWVAQHDARWVATVLCGRDGWRGYLYHVAVAPAWRRRGIATALVARAQNELAPDADGPQRIFEASRIVLPATMNAPQPRWCSVRGFFAVASVQAASTSSTKKPYLATISASASLHSRLA